MKATIDLDESLYRRLKVEAARRGRTVREMVAEGIRTVIDAPAAAASVSEVTQAPAWFGSLGAYAGRAQHHDLDAMRESVARGRKKRSR